MIAHALCDGLRTRPIMLRLREVRGTDAANLHDSLVHVEALA